MTSFSLRAVAVTGVLAALPALVACSAARGGERAQVAQQANEPRTGDATAAEPAGGIPPSTPMLTAGTKKPPPPPPAAAPSESSEPPPPSPPVAANVDDPKRISARHVLIQWMGSDRAGKSILRTREQALALAQDVLRRARAGEDLGRLANEYSDEPNAGSRGGSLGRFTRGQMVPAFDQVAFKLRVGQISDIVETPFGFHIIQRTE